MQGADAEKEINEANTGVGTKHRRNDTNGSSGTDKLRKTQNGDKATGKQVEDHTEDYEKEFEYLSKGKVYDDPTLYLYISSKNSKTDAPEDHENWFCMIISGGKLLLFHKN